MNLPLYNDDYFAAITEHLANKRILLCKPIGNFGDELIHNATLQFLDRINCSAVVVDICRNCIPVIPEVDYCVWGGGGNFGKGYYEAFQARQFIFQRAKSKGIKTMVLPCTCFGEPENQPDVLFVREHKTKELYPDAVLVPDMSMSLLPPVPYQEELPINDEGYFIRTYEESNNLDLIQQSVCDPATCFSLLDYFRLASEYKKIFTDRLHFAIVGLMLGRDVNLLPNSYWKNEAVWQSWLQRFGCQFGRK